MAVKYKDNGLGNKTGVYLINIHGEVLKLLCKSRPGSFCWGPVFSPNSFDIAFGRVAKDKGSDIYIAGAFNKSVKRITKDKKLESFWRFSPDGKRLYFVRFNQKHESARLAWNRFFDADIVFSDVKIGTEHPIVIDQYSRIRAFFVLPNEKYYILKTDKYKSQGHLLWKVDMHDWKKRTPIVPNLTPFAKQPMAKGTVYQKVTRKLPKTNIGNAPTHKTTWENVPIRFLDIHNPILSKDGSLLAFTWAKPGKLGRKLYICDMRTMKTILIDTPEHHETPLDISWNSTKIIFTTSAFYTKDGLRYKAYNLWIGNTDGTGLKKINPDFTDYYKKYPQRKPKAKTKAQPRN